MSGIRRNRLGWALKFSALFLSTALCIPGIYIACMLIKNYENLPLNTNRKCSFLIYVSQSKYVVVCVTFMWSFLDQYLDWSIHFLVAVLYCFSCRQTTSSINTLCSKKHFQPQTAWQKYFSVRKCLKEIEGRYSFLIFVLTGRSFVEFFRVLTFLLDLNAAAEDVLFSVLATFYSSIIFAVFLRVALSASGLLTSYRRLCEMMTELPRDLYCFEEDLEASRLFMRICADKNTVTLTAWGFFRLKKSFLLTAAATLVTYGVLLIQFR
ncbi:uncharacterized protein CDAR_303141 [Caerostris darwini]|uniref:Gustatory receptor n=1 Tax=Caerostris darwini TaxID=1538125 RepID=A0AAV4V3U3_9ARAC|nr:uncharacterized protein CDAR_303141 [Caerostris darwini]